MSLWGLWALSAPLRFYLQDKNRNHFQPRDQLCTDAHAPQRRQGRMKLMILGMLPTRQEQDEGLSNEKQIFFHNWEGALFHYGNYCNHEEGKPVCTHRHPNTPTSRQNSMSVCDEQVKFANNQSGGFILIITEWALTHRSICILRCCLHPSGRTNSFHSGLLYITIITHNPAGE